MLDHEKLSAGEHALVAGTQYATLTITVTASVASGRVADALNTVAGKNFNVKWVDDVD